MKPPKNGCVVLEALRHRGYQARAVRPEDVQAVNTVISDAREHVLPGDTMSFYSPTCPTHDGDLMEYLPMRPPYQKMWIETVNPDGGPVGFSVTSMPFRDNPEWTSIVMTGFWFEDGHIPLAVATAMYVVDERGRRQQLSAYAPIYGSSQDDRNRQTQDTYLFPGVRMLQRMSVTNIGFYCEHDEDENNPRLTHSQRRRLADRRYHVLVIREQADIRAGRLVVPYKGVMPLHWARGHYQYNGPASVHGHPDGRDRGLAFGTIPGVFWIQPHAKGKAENGIIDKDYRFAGSARKRRVKSTEQPAAEAFPACPEETADAAKVFSDIYRDHPVPEPQEANND